MAEHKETTVDEEMPSPVPESSTQRWAADIAWRLRLDRSDVPCLLAVHMAVRDALIESEEDYLGGHAGNVERSGGPVLRSSIPSVVKTYAEARADLATLTDSIRDEASKQWGEEIKQASVRSAMYLVRTIETLEKAHRPVKDSDRSLLGLHVEALRITDEMEEFLGRGRHGLAALEQGTGRSIAELEKMASPKS